MIDRTDLASFDALETIARRAASGTDDAFAPPAYLTELYWWAYAHPLAVWTFERGWLIDAILWGNYGLLRDAALEALGPDCAGRTLQVACAYGDFSPTLWRKVAAARGALEVIDALPAQIDNVRRKLAPAPDLGMRQMDSAALEYPDASFDRAVMFMLLHEQPRDWRVRTLREAARVLKPGGRLVVTDYAAPRFGHPLRYLLPPVLRLLEPYALDLWREPLAMFYSGLPLRPKAPARRFFGGLYQLVVLEKFARE